MAAEVVATAGHQVTVFEQHRSPGRKFLLAGRSGLNLTHAEPLEALLERYGPDRPALEAAVRAFDPDAARDWCAGLGEDTVVGTSGRVFPASHRATPLLRAWLARLASLGVEMQLQHRWTGWADDALRFENGDGAEVVVDTDATVIACGGPSWPRVGGDGSWSEAFADAGIGLTPFGPANCAVTVDWTSAMLDRHEGDPLKNISVAALGSGDAVRGDVVITKAGLEGGPIYALSRALRASAEPTLVFDLLPDLDVEAVTERLQRRRKGATQTAWLRNAGLSPVAIALLRDATGNLLPDDPAEMASLVKSTELAITGLASLSRAISSSGGVALGEVDEHFMLRSLPGVFVAGEMLDWEAPTGGYLLQACFSTGVAAARGVLRHLDSTATGS
jgi:uncharacterized flavoprotein (TIGR03862 family)